MMHVLRLLALVVVVASTIPMPVTGSPLRSATATVPVPPPLPIVAYDFPCSHLSHGVPLPIVDSGLIDPAPKQDTVSSSSSSFSSTSPLGPLHRPASSTTPGTTTPAPALSCPHHGAIDGVASTTLLESARTMGELLSSVTASAMAGPAVGPPTLAVEVWFTPATTTASSSVIEFVPILSIAAPVEPLRANTTTAGTTTDPCQGIELVIGQRGHRVEVKYRDHLQYIEHYAEQLFDDDDDDGHDGADDDNLQHLQQHRPASACRIVPVTDWDLSTTSDDNHANHNSSRPPPPPRLQQLVVVWQDYGARVQIYGNGDLLEDIDRLPPYVVMDDGVEDPNVLLRSWDPEYRLQLFSNSQQDPIQLATTTTNSKTTKIDTDTATTVTNSTTTGADSAPIFAGLIHRVALYNAGFDDENDVAVLFQEGMALRSNPCNYFFGPSSNTTKTIPLLASIPEPKITDMSPRNNTDSLRTTTAEDLLVTQGEAVTISLGARESSNSSTAFWDVMVEFVQVPRYGHLRPVALERRTTSFTRYHVGDQIRLPEGQTQIELVYDSTTTGEEDTDSFAYRLVALRKCDTEDTNAHKSMELGWSNSVQQQIQILPRKHNFALQGLPEEILQPEHQPQDRDSLPYGTLGDIVLLLDEADYDIDRVCVLMWTEEGTLTIDLDDETMNDMTFDITDCKHSTVGPNHNGLGSSIAQASPPSPFSNCGKTDGNMTIVATPTEVSKILSNIRYDANAWNQTESSISIRIFEGRGGNCGASDNTHEYEVRIPRILRPEELGATYWLEAVLGEKWGVCLIAICVLLCCLPCISKYVRQYTKAKRKDTKLDRNDVKHREQQGGPAEFDDYYGGLANSSSSTEEERSVDDLI